jgi:hypothetical protein
MGIRPSGGITHRPILEADEPPGAADTSER